MRLRLAYKIAKRPLRYSRPQRTRALRRLGLGISKTRDGRVYWRRIDALAEMVSRSVVVRVSVGDAWTVSQPEPDWGGLMYLAGMAGFVCAVWISDTVDYISAPSECVEARR